VASLILEQSMFYKKNPVKILPVKIHDQHGQSGLYNILCGFTYAKERGAQVINASFGYYALKRFAADGSALPDSSSLLLKEYIQYYLTETTGDEKPILLITAAGNKDLQNDDANEKALFTNAGLQPPQNLRNLDSVYFYPASLAADPELPNVISVTTAELDSNAVSPIQNYSQNIVDLGVDADMVFSDPSGNDKYSFKNPRIDRDFVDGSSYATPIAAGIIASHYNLIESSPTASSFNKNEIITLLLQPARSLGQATTVGNKIKSGVLFHRSP